MHSDASKTKYRPFNDHWSIAGYNVFIRHSACTAAIAAPLRSEHFDICKSSGGSVLPLTCINSQLSIKAPAPKKHALRNPVRRLAPKRAAYRSEELNGRQTRMSPDLFRA
jgi:hypothetical protein